VANGSAISTSWKGDDAMGVGSWRQPVNGWVSIGAGVRFFGIPAIL